VHGGLSPQLQSLDDIAEIDRFIEPPQSGPLCDLLWSDPLEDFTSVTDNDFEYNKTRGCSFCYSYEAVCNFLTDNNLLSMIRAHEVQDHGYAMLKKVEKTGFPSVITLFSAPNYCDSYKNKAAIMRYENNVINIRQFNHTSSPYYLPGFMNVFSWSIPFVAEKVGEILLTLYKLVDDDQEAKDEEEKLRDRQEKLRQKIKTVSKIYSLYHQMRKTREKSIQVGHFITKGGELPETANSLSEEELKKSLETFEGAKNMDSPLEIRPPQEKDYITQKTTSRPSLNRTVSLEAMLKEEPQKPVPLINMENTENNY